MDINDTLGKILDRLDDMGSQLKGVNSRLDRIEADVAEVKDRTKIIEVKLENDITERLDSLADGYKLNSEKLDGIKAVVDDIDSSVTALEVVTKFQNDKPITLQIIK